MASKIDFRDAILRPKSPPRRSGASLERPSGCRSALGTFQGRSWDVPGMLQSAIGTLLGRFWRLSGHLGAATEAHFSKIDSQFHCNVVLGPILEAPNVKNSDPLGETVIFTKSTYRPKRPKMEARRLPKTSSGAPSRAEKHARAPPGPPKNKVSAHKCPRAQKARCKSAV